MPFISKFHGSEKSSLNLLHSRVITSVQLQATDEFHSAHMRGSDPDTRQWKLVGADALLYLWKLGELVERWTRGSMTRGSIIVNAETIMFKNHHAKLKQFIHGVKLK